MLLTYAATLATHVMQMHELCKDCEACRQDARANLSRVSRMPRPTMSGMRLTMKVIHGAIKGICTHAHEGIGRSMQTQKGGTSSLVRRLS